MVHEQSNVTASVIMIQTAKNLAPICMQTREKRSNCEQTMESKHIYKCDPPFAKFTAWLIIITLSRLPVGLLIGTEFHKNSLRRVHQETHLMPCPR